MLLIFVHMMLLHVLMKPLIPLLDVPMFLLLTVHHVVSIMLMFLVTLMHILVIHLLTTSIINLPFIPMFVTLVKLTLVAMSINMFVVFAKFMKVVVTMQMACFMMTLNIVLL